MAQGRVINALVGASNKAKFPAIQGSALSVNMYYGRNGKDEYMESMPGLKLLKVVEENAKFRGSYVSTIGLDAEHSTEDMFAVFGNTLYRIILHIIMIAAGLYILVMIYQRPYIRKPSHLIHIWMIMIKR